MKKHLFFIVFLLLFATNTVSSQCSTCPPPPGGIGFNDNVNDEVPISGFVAIGLAIGAFYGIRKKK